MPFLILIPIGMVLAFYFWAMIVFFVVGIIAVIGNAIAWFWAAILGPPVEWLISWSLPYYFVVLVFSALIWLLRLRIQKFVAFNSAAAMLSIIMRVAMIISLITILILILTVWFDGHIGRACDDIMNTVACSSISLQYENSLLTSINSFFNPLRSLLVVKDPIEEAEMVNIAAIFYVICLVFRFWFVRDSRKGI